MIDLNIGLDGVPSLRKINIGNKYENNDEIINFILPSEFENYNKYIIAVIKQNGEKITKVLPIVDNIFYISSNITYIAGNWAMYLMCRENKIDIEAETIDISAKNGEHVFISDGFIGIVADSSIEKELVENAPIDTNLQLVYDDLLALKNEIIEKLNTPISYNNLVDVPTKVSQFENDKKYQTEEEVMGKISALIDSSPEFLDTLNEIANAIGNDPNFSVTIMKLINNKVEKEEGMGLSENSYTNAEKEKLNMLQNYDDTEVKFEINNLKNSIYTQNGILMIKNGGNN